MKIRASMLLLLVAVPAFAQQKADPQVNRGRYVVQIGGCNDCHTAGYAPSGGKVPEAQWLMGDALGWNGPWGRRTPPTCASTCRT
jgi:mono/diheme cytochrome c family protein